MNPYRFSAPVVFTLMLVLSGCSDDDPASPTIDHPTMTISGALQVQSGLSIPPTAKLCAVWSVDGDGDYDYVYGTGSIDVASGTFTITLGAPPAQALTSSPGGRPSFGVAAIALADFPDTTPHVLRHGEVRQVYGAVNNFAVVYVGGDPEPWASHQHLYWLANFDSGYNMGEGRETTGSWDIIVPFASSTPVLLVAEDSDAFRFPEWK